MMSTAGILSITTSAGSAEMQSHHVIRYLIDGADALKTEDAGPTTEVSTFASSPCRMAVPLRGTQSLCFSMPSKPGQSVTYVLPDRLLPICN